MTTTDRWDATDAALMQEMQALEAEIERNTNDVFAEQLVKVLEKKTMRRSAIFRLLFSIAIVVSGTFAVIAGPETVAMIAGAFGTPVVIADSSWGWLSTALIPITLCATAIGIARYSSH